MKIYTFMTLCIIYYHKYKYTNEVMIQTTTTKWANSALACSDEAALSPRMELTERAWTLSLSVDVSLAATLVEVAFWAPDVVANETAARVVVAALFSVMCG